MRAAWRLQRRDRMHFRFKTPLVPAAYAACAIASGIVLPRVEAWLWPHSVSNISVNSAIAIYSTVASGTMTLSAIVFSLTFVMVQFSATAYSPRLVLWLAEDPLISHALGVFTATFLYAIAAIAWVDRGNASTVPYASAHVVLLWLVASIAMFITLIQRVALLQVSRMLTFTGDQGRRVIAALYTGGRFAGGEGSFAGMGTGTLTQVLTHHGRPRAVQAIDVAALLALARGAQARIDVAVAVGDTLMESTPMLRVFGGSVTIPEPRLRNAIQVGHQRTFDQDPQYAIRLLVDIAIRALSPAINDPTTAVQALDEIGDLLLRLGRSGLTTAPFRDTEGIVRVVVPLPAWEDFLRLALEEISTCGATSVQVMRRMNALLAELLAALADDRHPAIDYWQRRLQRSITANFLDLDRRHEASMRDRQGLGVSNRPAA
jgi:uncharacterized membrane protein